MYIYIYIISHKIKLFDQGVLLIINSQGEIEILHKHTAQLGAVGSITKI